MLFVNFCGVYMGLLLQVPFKASIGATIQAPIGLVAAPK